MSDEEPEVATVVGHRLGDARVPTRVEKCHLCGENIGLSPSIDSVLKRHQEEHPGMPLQFRCVDCLGPEKVAALLKANKVPQPTPEQLEEMLRWMEEDARRN